MVAVRRFTAAVPDLIALVDGGGVDEEGARQLAEAVADRRNLVVSGGTGAGKTTLLNVLSTEIPADERVVAVEDTAELRLAGHVVRLEARPANAEGAGGDAAGSGADRTPAAAGPDHRRRCAAPGTRPGIGAQHRPTARCPRFTPTPPMRRWRLETLALSGRRRAGEQAVRRQLLAGIDLVVQVARRRGARRIQSISEVGPEGCVERWRW